MKSSFFTYFMLSSIMRNIYVLKVYFKTNVLSSRKQSIFKLLVHSQWKFHPERVKRTPLSMLVTFCLEHRLLHSMGRSWPMYIDQFIEWTDNIGGLHKATLFFSKIVLLFILSTFISPPEWYICFCLSIDRLLPIN